MLSERSSNGPWRVKTIEMDTFRAEYWSANSMVLDRGLAKHPLAILSIFPLRNICRVRSIGIYSIYLIFECLRRLPRIYNVHWEYFTLTFKDDSRNITTKQSDWLMGPGGMEQRSWIVPARPGPRPFLYDAEWIFIDGYWWSRECIWAPEEYNLLLPNGRSECSCIVITASFLALNPWQNIDALWEWRNIGCKEKLDVDYESSYTGSGTSIVKHSIGSDNDMQLIFPVAGLSAAFFILVEGQYWRCTD